MAKKKNKKKTIKLDPLSSFIIIILFIIGLALGYFVSTKYLFNKKVSYKLIGDEICNIEINGTYVEEGIELKIGKKDYSKDVVITSDVDTSSSGIYYVYYTYDKNNVSINTTRVVIVGGI